jgi:hypothetical protein
MTAIHTNVPLSVLPTELAADNKLTTEYESYTLIPRLGPLAYSYMRKKTRSMLSEFMEVIALIDAIKAFENRWKMEPVFPVYVLENYREMEIINPELHVINPADRVDNPVIAQPIIESAITSPMERFRRTANLNRDNVRRMSVLTTGARISDDNINSEMVEDHAEIVARLSADNALMNGMVMRGELAQGDKFVSSELTRLPTEKAASQLVSNILKGRGDRGATKVHKTMAINMIDDLIKTEKRFGTIADYLRDINLKDQAADLVAGGLKDIGLIGTEESLSDVNIIKSREWAFFRKEHVDIELQTPKLRGPVAVNSVSPDSELFIQQSRSVTSQSLLGTSRDLSSVASSSLTLASHVKSNMGTLFDYGSNLGTSMSEQGFSRDTNRSEKRAIVESTMQEISQKNATQTLSGSSVTSGQLREYRTEGKDQHYSSTEVAFEVFSPVKVTHYLDAIGTVWCPRVLNPYRELITLINEYEEMVRAEYIEENKVINPAVPIPTYDDFTEVAAYTKKVTDFEDDDVFEETLEVELSAADKAKGYIFDNTAKCHFEQRDTGCTNAVEPEQYKVFPARVEVIEGSKAIVHTKYKIIEEPWGSNPHYIRLKVVLTKYRYSQTYLEQLKDYEHTIEVVNPARRSAVEVQAKKYARLKREELVKKYENNISDLKDFNFTSLMKSMFTSSSGNKGWSYYHGIIKSCIDWNKATYEVEPGTANALLERGKSPYHFLNADAVRFFLPIHEHSEEAFFEAVGNTVDRQWRDMFKEVKDYVDQQRRLVDNMRDRMSPEDIKQLTLDEYDSEMVLGRHLESVLSNHPFSKL